MHMTHAKRPSNSISCDLDCPFHLTSSKGNSYILTCICPLTNYPTAIPLQDTHAEIVLQAYLKQVYAAFVGSLTMITDNSKDFKIAHLKR